MSYPVPNNEAQRLEEVTSLNILDTAEEDEYNALVDLVAAITGCPVSLISIVARDRQWFKARKGFDESGTSREVSFCAHTIMQDELFIVEDTHTDERFSDNPLVTGPAKIRFYAGMPFKSPAGHAIGTVCVIDTIPRKLDAEKKRALQVVAEKVGELIWLRSQKELNETVAERRRKQLEQQAEEQKALHDQELSRIGYSLHEDYAQSIAACLKFIEISRSTAGLEAASIDRTQQVLEEVLMKMRKLSMEINPAHFQVGLD